MKSRMKLDCIGTGEKTVISDLYCEAPYKIMSPFYDGKKTEVIQMAATAGMLSGDVFDLEINLNDGADLTYTTQSYEKIFESAGEMTQKHTCIHVGPGCALRYTPKPVIPFAGSCFQATNEIYLDSSSYFLYADIYNCGRTAMGEYFRMKYFSSRTVVYVDEVPVFIDRTMLDPSYMRYDTVGMWGKHTHNGLVYVYAPKELELPSFTACHKGWVSRMLAMRGEDIEKYAEDIRPFL